MGCRTFIEQDCLLEASGKQREEWNCRICRVIAGWRKSGVPALAVQEIRKDACYVFPLLPESGEDPSRSLMILRIDPQSDAEARVTVQSLLTATSNAWLHEQGSMACIPVKETG